MNARNVGSQTNPVLRVVWTGLRACRAVLVFATALSIPLAAVVLSGHIAIQVPAQLESPYSVVFGNATLQFDGLTDPFVGVSGEEIVTRGNLPVGDEAAYIRDTPRVRNDVTVVPEDTDTRGVIVVLAGVALGLAWVALVNLIRLVETAVEADPFDASNPARLRRLGALAIAVPVVTSAGSAALNRTLEVDPAYRVLAPGPSWLAALVGAVVLLALAEVFRAGSVMRELDSLTV